MSSGCPCCGRTNAHYVPVRAPDGLPSRPVVCGLCAKHQGSNGYDLKRRDHTHIDMWREDLRDREQALTDAHEQVVGKLQAQITRLEGKLEERPIQTVEVHVDKAELDEAWRQRDRAFRSRDRVMTDMTLLHLLHFETSSGKCRCGLQASRCEEMTILDGSRALNAWERWQTERRRRQEHHQLPSGHPGVVDARWDPDDATADAYRDFHELGVLDD